MTRYRESQVTRESLIRFARADGIDLERQHDVVLDLAAIGLTHLVWRNTALEDAHAGGRIDDADMFAANVTVWRALRSALGATPVDWWAMVEFVSDPELRMPNDSTIRATMRGYGWRAWRQRARNILFNLWDDWESEAAIPPLWRLAVSGAGLGRYWYGTPWWPLVVDDFIATLGDPSSRRAGWLATHPEIGPPPLPLAEMRAGLVEAPELLDHATRAWCTRLAIGMPEGNPVEAWHEASPTIAPSPN